MTKFRVGVDIGGTFTDIVFLGDDGKLLVVKVASTPDDFSKGVIEGLRQGLSDLDGLPQDITELNHGFTVATNAILEGKGERIALVTTEGFRDVLELARLRTPRLYDLYYVKPPALVDRALRFELKERMSYKGEVLVPVDIDDLDRVVDSIADTGVRSVAISFLHSYANPDHEIRVASALEKRISGLNISVSSEILPEMREYERTSTTVINAYVQPIVDRYLLNLAEQLSIIGVQVPLTVMQSNGGLIPAEMAARRPIYCIESGPAAGVVGAYHFSKRLGIDNIMTFDMGGTTAKASIIEGGQILYSPEYEVGGGMSLGHRLLKGSGYILRVPTIDIAEVSSGGGSIAWLDKATTLQIGPNSAGAVPGPVCYKLGGEEPTVTDANVMLGYLNPKYLLGGDFPINSAGSRGAIVKKLGTPMGLEEIKVAHGIHMLANSNVARALRAVSSERGRDPRRFTLMAFGGGGPIHAAGLAEMLSMSRVIVPSSPGVFSSFGLLFADVEHHFVKTYMRTLTELDWYEANNILNDLKLQGRNLLLSEAFQETQQQIVTQIDMKYLGQTSELTVTMPYDTFDAESISYISQAYLDEHEKTYGYQVDEAMQLVALRVLARGISKESRVPDSMYLTGQQLNNSDQTRMAYFGETYGWIETPVVDRGYLNGSFEEGPLIVEEYSSTTVVPPSWRVYTDGLNNLVLESVNQYN